MNHYMQERGSLYLVKKYEQNHHNIKSVSKPKLCVLIGEEFHTLREMHVSTFPKADLFKEQIKFENYLDIKNK